MIPYPHVLLKFRLQIQVALSIALAWCCTLAPAATRIAPAPDEFESGVLTARETANLEAAARLVALVRYFDPSSQASGVKAWDLFTIQAMESVFDAVDAQDLAARLAKIFTPISPLLEVWAGGPDFAPPEPEVPEGSRSVRYWEHQGVGSLPTTFKQFVYSSQLRTARLTSDDLPFRVEDRFHIANLGGGVSCRLSLIVYRNWTGPFPLGSTPQEWTVPPPNTAFSLSKRATRFADIATAWGVMEHFYPYFDVVDTDWDKALTEGLKQTSEATSDADHLMTLRRLIAQLHDGHGSVTLHRVGFAGCLPITLDWTGPDLIVVGVDPGFAEMIGVGEVVRAINDKPIAEVYTEVRLSICASTEGWAKYLAAFELTCPRTSDPVEIEFLRPDGEVHRVLMKPMPIALPMPKKGTPESGTEVSPGVVYFNLVGAESDQLRSNLETLTSARGIIFDMRGYPAGAAYEAIRHLIDRNVASAQWHVPVITRPGRAGWRWDQSAWDMPPKAPHWDKPVAFLTSSAAISYAESIMGIVEHYKLGDIVGSTTAGTNGNVNPFVLPGGAIVGWTGMKVLKHDGSTHHGVGILPTVPVVPTPAGVAAGRDEVLEKAIEVIAARLGEAKTD